MRSILGGPESNLGAAIEPLRVNIEEFIEQYYMWRCGHPRAIAEALPIHLVSERTEVRNLIPKIQ